jgi:hypothetical protein
MAYRRRRRASSRSSSRSRSYSPRRSSRGRASYGGRRMRRTSGYSRGGGATIRLVIEQPTAPLGRTAVAGVPGQASGPLGSEAAPAPGRARF